MLSLLRLYVYTLLQNYRERVSKRHFGNDQLHQELQEANLDYTSKDSREECMEEIDKLHLLTNYQHQCHPECQIRGKVIKLASHTKPQNNWVFCVLCRLWQAVCNWQNLEVEILCLHYVDCCPGEPVHGKPFCWNHAGIENSGVPLFIL